MMLQATGVVLAGGKSTRMGTDKALLLLDNQTLLERSVKKLQEIFAEVIIVGDGVSNYSIPDVKTVPDIRQGCGPLGGIHTALRHAAHDQVFVTACDMPFWKPDLAQLLVASCVEYDGAVPMVDAYFEPLLAVYNKSCLPAIEDCLSRKRYQVTGFYDQVHIHFIERGILERVCKPDEDFRNINSRDDLSIIKQILLGKPYAIMG